jgi:hypothetical protein
MSSSVTVGMSSLMVIIVAARRCLPAWTPCRRWWCRRERRRKFGVLSHSRSATATPGPNDHHLAAHIVAIDGDIERRERRRRKKEQRCRSR